MRSPLRPSVALVGALLVMTAIACGDDDTSAGPPAGDGGASPLGGGGEGGSSAGTSGTAGSGTAGFPSGTGGSSGMPGAGGQSGFPSGEGSGGAGGSGAAGSAGAGTGGTSTAGGAGGSGAAGASGSATGPCKTECLGVECGPIPDGCGATLSCGDCGHPEEYCIKYATPKFQSKVHASIELVKTEHPEYFDFNDAMGESVQIVVPLEYRDAVVVHVNEMGLLAIADVNDEREIRVRSQEDAAENYLIRTSGGYSAYKYTSTCTPSYF
jgi:hypothetical protein